MYRGIFKGEEIFICRQVDDFKVADPNKQIIRDVIQAIEGDVMLVAKDKLLTHYNGVDYDQTCEYIKVHATKYLMKILQNKGWDKTKKNKENLVEPMHPNSVKELEIQ